MRSWRYHRNLFIFYATLFLLLVGAASALRQPVWWLAVPPLWLLHQSVRSALAFVHPQRNISLLADPLEDFKPVQFQSRDGLTISGFFTAHRNGITILLAHGLGASAHDLALLARLLVREGFGVLLPDLRAHGHSQGDTSTLGWKEGEDLVCAVEFLRKRVDVHGDRICAYGFSLGAQAVLRAALLTQDIRGLVLEGLGPVRLSDHGGAPRGFTRWLNLPGNWLFYPLQAWMAGASQPGVLEVIGSLAPRPVLLIAGGPPGGSELYFNRLFFEAARQPKEIWETPTAAHGSALVRDPDEYMQRITTFFHRAVKTDTEA